VQLELLVKPQAELELELQLEVKRKLGALPVQRLGGDLLLSSV
jgi:hypothetical protein